jgi:DNA adenine methylase
LRRVVNKHSYAGSDANALLITLLRAAQRGETMPRITREEYTRLRHQRGTSLRRAVAAFTYSFNGKEWGGYTDKYHGCASTAVRYPPQERMRYYRKLYENDTFRATKLSHARYTTLRPKNKLIYCDPPYQGSTPYATGPFNHKLFWSIMRRWSRDNVVFISEYRAPPDFEEVSSSEKSMSLRGADKKEVRVERLFMHPACRKQLRRLALHKTRNRTQP